MKSVGKVCYGKYEGGIIYKEDKNNFYIDIDKKKIDVIELRPDPNSEINSSYYTFSSKEALNTGISIGMGGMLGLLNFNGIKGASSYTIEWMDGSQSNFEFDNADDENAGVEFFHVIQILQYFDNVWELTLNKYKFILGEKESLMNWLEDNRKKIIQEMLIKYENWTSTSKYYELVIYKASVYTLLNIDINKRVYNGNEIGIIIDDIANANTMNELDNIYLDAVPTLKAKTLVRNGSITSSNFMQWVMSFKDDVDDFSQFLDNTIKMFQTNKLLEEIAIYMFKEQFKHSYSLLKMTLKISLATK